ncbi:MAG TPA: hypothetical protein VFB49_10350 [Patescibacteria group bacterium]|nr:hypothetical protein [Patescibacteria group bacterium]
MSEGGPARRDPVFPAIGVISLAVLILELALTRLFSATLHYHFAFMAISLALLGSGSAGVAIYLAQDRLRLAGWETWGARAAVLFALTTVTALLAVLLLSPGVEGTAGNGARIAAIYVACVLPFFCAGCAVTLAVMSRAAAIARLYRFDLAGAAAGCLLLVPLLDRIGGVNTILVVPVAAACGGALFGRAPGAAPREARRALAVAAAAAALLGLNLATGWIDVRQAKGTRETHVLLSRWNSFSRVTVTPAEGSGLEIRIDADASTLVTAGAGEVSRHPEARDRLTALPYAVMRRPSVLVMGPGGGDDVMVARFHDARAVTAVEINPIIARDIMSSEPYLSFSGGLFRRPGVRLVVDDARSFISRSEERFDLIQGTMVDTWAATAAGAFALTENHLYTVEAFQDYDRHLADDGVLSLTRWYFEPPDQVLRLVSLAREVMRRRGVTDPASHLVIVRDRARSDPRTPAMFLYKKSAFTDEEVKALEGFASWHQFTVLYSPATRPANDFTRLAEAERPETVWSAYPTNIAPTTDDSPFFFNSVRPGDLLHLADKAPEWRKTNVGTLILFLLFALVAALVAVLVVGPLLLARRRAAVPAGAAPWLAYFLCLGAGFILVEVALVQRFILFLGPPVYALTVVLFSLLLFGGLGSGLSARIAGERVARRLGLVLLAVCGAAVLAAFALSPLVHALVHLGRPARIALSVALIAPLATLMGMPMPTGLRMLRAAAPDLLPWAWGLNGAASVLGSVGALIIAIAAGFDATLLAGAAFYLAGWIALARVSSSAARAPG